MPNPLEILLDPLSLTLLAIYAGLIGLEFFFPARRLPKVKGWFARSMVVFVVYFYLSSYLPLVWDQYLVAYQLFDLSHLNIYLATFMGLLVFELLIYIWHRTMHQVNGLWLSFHQMHHSAERLDSFGAFYFSPLDMVGFTLIGSLAVSLLVGISAEAVSLFLYITMFLAIFPHLNVKTPQWLGYIIQRPESHSVHHQKGVHAFNYSDLPLFDLLFGTFNNPKEFKQEAGFYQGASRKIPQMLMFKDVYMDNKQLNEISENFALKQESE